MYQLYELDERIKSGEIDLDSLVEDYKKSLSIFTFCIENGIDENREKFDLSIQTMINTREVFWYAGNKKSINVRSSQLLDECENEFRNVINLLRRTEKVRKAATQAAAELVRKGLVSITSIEDYVTYGVFDKEIKKIAKPTPESKVEIGAMQCLVKNGWMRWEEAQPYIGKTIDIREVLEIYRQDRRKNKSILKAIAPVVHIQAYLKDVEDEKDFVDSGVEPAKLLLQEKLPPGIFVMLYDRFHAMSDKNTSKKKMLTMLAFGRDLERLYTNGPLIGKDMLALAEYGYVSLDTMIDVYGIESENPNIPEQYRVTEEALKRLFEQRPKSEHNEKTEDFYYNTLVSSEEKVQLLREKDEKDPTYLVDEYKAHKITFEQLASAKGNKIDDVVLDEYEYIPVEDIVSGLESGAVSIESARLYIGEKKDYHTLFKMLDLNQMGEETLVSLLQDENIEDVRRTFKMDGAVGLFENNMTNFIGYANGWIDIDDLQASLTKKEDIDEFVDFMKKRQEDKEKVTQLYGIGILSDSDVHQMLPEEEADFIIMRFDNSKAIEQLGLQIQKDGYLITKLGETEDVNFAPNSRNTAISTGKKQKKYISMMDPVEREEYIQTLGFSYVGLSKEQKVKHPDLFFKGYTPYINTDLGIILQENYKEPENATYMCSIHDLLYMDKRSKAGVIEGIKQNPNLAITRTLHTKRWGRNLISDMNVVLASKKVKVEEIYDKDEMDVICEIADQIGKNFERQKALEE